MRYANPDDFLRSGKAALAKGPVALIFAEDDVEIASTLRHHLDLGFRAVILFVADTMSLDPALEERVQRVGLDFARQNAVTGTVNRLAAAAPDVWFYYCFNAEYLFFPFCENRTVGEMISFAVEERRDTILNYVIDLYAGDLTQFPDAVSLEHALLDKSGYYALARRDKWNNDKDRQLDFFGGLRWRYEEHVPVPRRKIDRVALFRAQPGITLLPDFTFDEDEYNTYACPWHHSISAATCSFRTAKALKRNPGSTFDIGSFTWHNSTPFEWHSQQLLNLGLIEPGQWF